MKKMFSTATLAVLLSISSVFATEKNNSNDAAIRSFEKLFTGASFVEWSSVNDLKKATFVWGGFRTIAFFDAEGSFRASIRGMFMSQAPIKVARSFSDTFSDAVALEVNEITNEEGTSYKVMFERNKKTYSTNINVYGDVTGTTRLK